ncbi:ABC-2 type transport system permease protein [Melghirimyces profundicolus]|uniref:Transport permease protein n=1 Tax=Melghirimyces profundicolus TaxID=1242148 RepID=A0A2T6B3J2_9BACL|nr:ABC transporter permease [Melghirimyces profundicolus]PTX50639.1 ABC-2 type transport system permease protein [Melghirimyces profundicolus]
MLAHLMKYKELMYFLVHKELRIRYRNSLFGFFWTLLEPLGLMVIYTVVFGYLVNLNKGLPEGAYPLYVLAGLIPWTFFNNSVRKGTKALSGNASLIKKVYFPREIFPLTMLISNLVNFIPAFALVLVMAMVMNQPIHGDQLALLPGMILLQAFFTLGVALLVSVLNVYYRDVEFIVNLLMRAWMYLCPIIYPMSRLYSRDTDPVVQQLADLYWLNPMAVIISLYHGIFFPEQGVPAHPAVPGLWIIYTILVTIILFFAAWYLFRKMNRRVGEVI